MKLFIGYDQCTDNPLENNDGMWTMYSFNHRHGNFKSPWEFFVQGRNEPTPISIGLARKLKVGTAFILSCYEHSGIQWGLQGETHQCQFDTARVAGLLVWEHKPGDMGAKTYADRQKDARGCLKEYNAWCNGECYYYRLEDDDGKDVDSCGGFVGSEWLVESIYDAHPELFKDDKKTLKEEVELSGDASFVLK